MSFLWFEIRMIWAACMHTPWMHACMFRQKSCFSIGPELKELNWKETWPKQKILSGTRKYQRLNRFDPVEPELQPIGFLKCSTVWLLFGENKVSLWLTVCIFRGRPRGDAHEIGHYNWAKARDPSGSWVQYSNPAVPLIPRHSRWTVLVQ